MCPQLNFFPDIRVIFLKHKSNYVTCLKIFQIVSLWCMLSHSVLSDILWPHAPYPARLLCPWDFPSKNTGVGCHFLLQGIFLTQRSNLHLPLLLHWQADSVVTLSHRGSPVSLYVQEKIQTSFFFLFICLSFKNKNHICLRHIWWFDVPIHSEMITTVKLINISISSQLLFFFYESTWNLFS